jgi:hypothetical protein
MESDAPQTKLKESVNVTWGEVSSYSQEKVSLYSKEEKLSCGEDVDDILSHCGKE